MSDYIDGKSLADRAAELLLAGKKVMPDGLRLLAKYYQQQNAALAAREPAPGLHMSQHDMNVTPVAQPVAVPDELKLALVAANAGRAVAVPDERLITSASELEVGKTYWVKPANGAHHAYQPHFSNCGESGGWKYIAWPTDVSRMWADERNDQFTGHLIAFGPCEPPGFSLAAAKEGKQ